MDSRRIRGTNPDIISAARRLRLTLTPAEQVLWRALKNRQLNGLKFRLQHPVESFVVDFYCPQHRLVIEVDGAVHDQQLGYDIARTERLNQLGYRVMSNLDYVLQQIVTTTES
jgi:very-short-patch-repair endonuclease